MKHVKYILGLFVIAAFASCSDGFLDIKPNKSQVVPQTAEDLWALLMNTTKMNVYYPSIGEVASDNHYYEQNYWQGLTDLDSRNAYIWNPDIFVEGEANDWSFPYVTVFTANVVLESLEKNKGSIAVQEYNALKGSALFFRGYAFFQLAQHFMEAYDESHAGNKLGIPLRLTSDLNTKSVRSTMSETYTQIITDLDNAAELLPMQSRLYNLPGKAAGYMMLAKTYLVKGEYALASIHANRSFELTDAQLIDYNDVDTAANTPFARFNSEVIFYSLLMGRTALTPARLRMDDVFYASYSESDLRKRVYFRKENNGYYSFKGSYDGTGSAFGGLAIDELYLILAESHARLSETEKACFFLNEFLRRRIRKDAFIPIQETVGDDILLHILDHRRKQLILRGTRWSDLKRLNRDERFAKTVTRKVNGEEYRLEPNARRYVFPIPLHVISLTGMEQNE